VDRGFKEASKPPESPTIASKELTELLRELGVLRDAGILTDDEFAAKKAEILVRL